MDKFDVIRLYQDGYSINHIIDLYYRFKKQNSRDVCSYLDKKILIINIERIKKEDCRKYIEKILYDYLFNNNSVEQF